jgi:Ca2+-binding EF-hand superfamily protein
MTNDKTPKRKKSETLEVRLPYETKQAFLTACREDGTTASEVVRTSIDTYLEERERPDPLTQTGNVIAMIPKPLRSRKVAIGLAGAASLAVLSVLPSAADPDYRSSFARLDKNKDNVLSIDEFMPQAKDGEEKKIVSFTTRTEVTSNDEKPAVADKAPVEEQTQDAYSFWLPGEDGQTQEFQQQDVKIMRRVHIEKTDGVSEIPKPDVAEIVRSISFDDIRKDEFAKYDADKDGKIILSEYEARQRAMLTRGFQVLDADKSGQLSSAEYLKIGLPEIDALPPDVSGDLKVVRHGGASDEVLKATFAKLDRNRDGQLSLAEYLPPS